MAAAIALDDAAKASFAQFQWKTERAAAMGLVYKTCEQPRRSDAAVEWAEIDRNCCRAQGVGGDHGADIGNSTLILAELLGLPPMRRTAHSRQFARIVTRSSLRRGVREEPIEVAADKSFLLAGSRPLNCEIVSTFL